MRQAGALSSTLKDNDSGEKSKGAVTRGKPDGLVSQDPKSRPISQISPEEAEARHLMHLKHVASLEREDTHEHP